MEDPGYQVVVARLVNGEEDVEAKAAFNDQYGTLMKIIRESYVATMITNVRALDLRTMFRPKAILLVTDEITKPHNVNTHKALARYVENGGTLILCCWFITKSTAWGIEGLLWEFKCGWTVAEGLEDFERTNLRLNESIPMKQKFGDEAYNYIEKSYYLEAVHLKGVAEQDQIYCTAGGTQFPAVEALEIFAESTPSAFRKHGRGFLGYVGDTRLTHGTQSLIVAMLEATTSRHAQAGNQKPFPPRQPPNRQQQTAPATQRNVHTIFDNSANIRPNRQAPNNRMVLQDGVLSVAKPGTRSTSQVMPSQGCQLGSLSAPHSVKPRSALMDNNLPRLTSKATIANESASSSANAAAPGSNRNVPGKTDQSRNSNEPTTVRNQRISNDAAPAEMDSSVNNPTPSVVSGQSRDDTIRAPTLERVARHDVTALHRVYEDSDMSLQTDDYSIGYGGGVQTPSVHTDISGPPAAFSVPEDGQLAVAWNTAGGEIYCPSEIEQEDGVSVASSTVLNQIDCENGWSKEQNRGNWNLDDESLYSVSTGAPPKYFETNAGMPAQKVQSSGADTTSTALVKRSSANDFPMPALAPCNPGCAVCTILYPAMKCVGCKKVQYCSAACQRSDWEKHKDVCKVSSEEQEKR